MDAYQWKVGVVWDDASATPNVVMQLVNFVPQVTITFSAEQAESMAESLLEQAGNARQLDSELTHAARGLMRNLRKS